MSDYPTVDIVILNYNGKKFLDDCILSVQKSTYPSFKIYLLDNASTEDDVSYVRQHYPEVEIIRVEVNRGFCAAYNLAFEQCRSKYFVCLNNDVKVKPDWLGHLVALAESDETIATLQPKMVSYLDENNFEYAGACGGMMDKYGYPFARGRLFDNLEADNGQYNDVSSIFWACGAAMFIRRSVLEESGYFDETLVFHMDEIDLNWRMHLLGYGSKVIPQAVILHYGGATIQPASFKKMYWNHRNSVYLMLKNYDRFNVLTKTPVHILLDYVAILYSVITLNFTMARAILSAHFWIATHLPLIWRNRKIIQSKRKVADCQILKKMFPKSIVVQYFLLKRKTYSALLEGL